MVHGHAQAPGRRIGEPPRHVAASRGVSSGCCSQAAPTQPLNHSVVSAASLAPSRQGLGAMTTSAPNLANRSAAAPTASGPSSWPSPSPRRWWALKADAIASSNGSDGARATRPVTEMVSNAKQPASTQDRAIRSTSAAVSMSSNADAVINDAPDRSRSVKTGDVALPRLDGYLRAVGRQWWTIDGRAAEQIGVPVVHHPLLRPESCGASQRAIEPVPQPRSCTTTGRLAGKRCRTFATKSVARAAASAGSRNASQSGLTVTTAGTTGSRRGRREYARDPLDGRRPAGQRPATLLRRHAEAAPQLGIAQPTRERGGERGRVTRRDEQTWTAPVSRVTESVRQPTDGRRDHRQATRERLGDDHPVGLAERRDHEHVRGGISQVELVARTRAGETDPIADSGLLRPAVQEIGEVTIAIEGSHKDAMPRQFADGGEGREQDVVPLVWRDRRDAEQLPAVGRAGRKFGGSRCRARPPRRWPAAAGIGRGAGRASTRSS